MDIDTNTRNGTSTVTPGNSSEHEDDTTLNKPIPIDTDMLAHSVLSPTPDEPILIDTDMPDHPELSPMPDEPIPIDTDTPDHPGHSRTPEVQSTTHRRLTIASLCNPSNEDLYVRPYRADTLFDKTLEPVRVPSRIRGCSSESLYIYIFL
jgi:hypothetical protein